jgi:hypothetical protein
LLGKWSAQEELLSALAGAGDATHWSIPSMATATGFLVHKGPRWAAFGLQPHRSQTFKLSSDPLFVDKVRDIVGLYLSPPNRALVLALTSRARSRRSTVNSPSCR